MAGASSQAPRLAVDIGGTFTDAVVEHGGELIGVKVPTTASAPEEGFLDCLRLALERAGLAARDFGAIIHGTTLATNALIERKGAKTALITTEGFRDSLEIAYEARYDQYDMFLDKPRPLVPRSLRFTVPERVNVRGEVLTPLDEGAVLALVPDLLRLEVESVAVGFIHGYANPAHERHVREILGAELPELAVTLSGEVCPELREYERLSTATANAYILPAIARYLRALDAALDEEGFDCPLRLVTSAGGMTTLETAARFPIRLVESGPSGGAIFAKAIAAQCGEAAVLSYDMGGTTAKICLIEDYTPMTAREIEVARAARFMKGSGLPLRIPVVEMIEIGAGGGSVAHVDALGRIAVGPESAGSEPGPACYGRGGGRATVSDADLLLGRLDAARFADGSLCLDEAAAGAAVAADVGGPLALPLADAAHGIAEIVDENMANSARIHAVEHGKDLSAWTMIAFGGAGPLHAAQLADKLGLARLIVPVNPSVGSAVGFLWAPVAYEVVRSRYMTVSAFDWGAAQALLDTLEAEARDIVAAGAGGAALGVRRTALMRYVGQGHEVEIELPEGRFTPATAGEIRERYERRYVELYGRALADAEIEILTWNLAVATPERTVPAVGRAPNGAVARAIGHRRLFDTECGAFAEVPAYWRPDLPTGCALRGPALVVEGQTTTVVPASFSLLVDDAGNLVIERADGKVEATG